MPAFPYSGVLVFPIIIPPADLILSTEIASSSAIISAGIDDCIMDATEFSRIFLSIREIFFSLIDKGRIYGFIDNNPWYHISNPRDLNKINLLLK